MKLRLLFLIVVITICIGAKAQVSGYGKLPTNPIIICGNLSFIQDSISIDSGKNVPNPVCHNGINYVSKNAFWYKINCVNTGTFGFMINPKQSSDDYDWEIFDITNRNPNDVFTDSSIFVAFNWSGVVGPTGTVATATDSNSCASAADTSNGGIPTPNKTIMPLLLLGHEYLLMVSHFSNSQFGYTIYFNGGTAGINNSPKPGNTIYNFNSDSSVTLNVSGDVPNVAGFNYQWVQGINGTSNWNNIAGANSPTISFPKFNFNYSSCYWLNESCNGYNISSTPICNIMPKISPSLSIDLKDTTSCSFTVDVSVRGKELYNISKLTGSIGWDTTFLNFGGIKFASKGIVLDSTKIDFSNVANGKMAYNWTDTIGHSAADSTPVFTLTFYPKKNFSGGIGVWFDSIPTKLEIDTAIGVATTKASFNDGWVLLNDTPTIVQVGNILQCFAGCLPIHYQWYENGNPITRDTLNYITPTSGGSYTCTVTYISGARVSSLPINVVLPVTMLNFKCYRLNEIQVILNWQTATETNTSHFNIQRSTDGKDFVTVAKVNAKGAGSYTFNAHLTTDDSRFTKLFYRLQIEDKDGTLSYSEVKELSIINCQLSIAPNPAKSFVTITGSNIKEISILDLYGRTLMTKAMNTNTINLAINNLSKGIYLVKAIQTNGSIKTEKLLVE